MPDGSGHATAMRAEVTAGGRTMERPPQHLGPGPANVDRTRPRTAPSSWCRRRAPTSRATRRGSSCAGSTARRDAARHQGIRRHRVARGAAASRRAGTIEVPIAADDVGDVWVNVTFVKDDDLFLAEKRVKVPPLDRRLQVSVVAGADRVAPARAGRLHRPDARRRRRTRRGAGQRRRRGRGRLRREARRHAGPGVLLLPPPLRRRLHVLLAQLLVHRLLGHAAAEAGAAAPASDEPRRLQGRASRASRRCGRTSPTPSSGWPTS